MRPITTRRFSIIFSQEKGESKISRNYFTLKHKFPFNLLLYLHRSCFLLFNLLHRLGVVGNNSKMVKDCYLLPLSATDNLNRALLPLDGPGIEESRPDMLLALVVRTRRKRPGDTERDAEKLRLQLYKKSKNETARSATDIITLDHTGDKRMTNKGKLKEFRQFGNQT